MEQPKKPGTARDITDLKARLGLARAPAAAPPPMGAPTGSIPALPPQAYQPAPTTARSLPPGAGAPVPAPFAAPVQAPAPVAQAPAYDPYAAMKPPSGRQFDLRPLDDGSAIENVRSRGGRVVLLGTVAALVIGGGIGWGFGVAAVGRANFNSANAAAKKVRADLTEMQKTLTQIGQSVAMSQQRLGQAKQDPLSYDPKLIEDLEKVKLDPRPDTGKIFRVDYYRLEDLVVDRLMNYYYDSIALYGEVERHVKKTKADKPSLEAFASKQADEKGGKNYGVVFDTRGKLAIASLVEIGKPVCKGGNEECGADQIEGFQIRANTGANWFNRPVGPKPDMKNLVPIDIQQPLVQTVMSGSPDQVRMEQYKQRYSNIRMIVGRLTAAQKELAEQVGKAAGRENIFSIFALSPEHR